MSKLVIVESPTKVKKIQQYLPDGFVVDSCVGHIRDLPSKKSEVPAAYRGESWADYGVNVDDGFKPIYITIRGKGKVIEQLKKKLRDADELFLATDEDREGESISWHLVQALSPKVPVHRMVFNEITKKAVRAALEAPRPIDDNLVQAQETRRILDRLYGYALSPLLWKKVGGNLSAGRVQSVAVRLVVMRERERRAFKKAEYWDLKATLHKDSDFDAGLVSLGGRRIASGKDFDKDTGKVLEGRDVLVLDQAQAHRLAERLREVSLRITDVQHVPKTSRPPAPFTTSTLQQDANNRLGLSARRTMDAAQRLYQNGLITYMRTDSTELSEEALQGARAAVLAGFGDDHYAGPRRYRSKKSAQEAHEAIRPAGEEFQHPEQADISGDDRKLYRLIWQRTLASQMADERFTSTSVAIDADDARFTATGKTVQFLGWRAAYAATQKDGNALPALQAGDVPELRNLLAEGHETKPPARFTEATLVKSLEEEGIGRPSTYASILDTIQRRGYVVARGKALAPSFTAFAVTGLLEKHFPQLVDTGFTAQMEDTLDAIAQGEADWVPFLEEFFLGEDGLRAQIEARMQDMDPQEARIIDLGDIPYTVKIGRFGPYVEVEQDGQRVSASIPEGITPDELDDATLARLLQQAKEGPRAIGDDPETGQPVYILEGRFGPYYQRGEGKEAKRASLPKGKGVDDAELEEALWLLSLPLELGPHPDGGRVVAGIGRYGPFVAHDQGASMEYRSIPKGRELQDIELHEALGLLAQPKGRAARAVLKDLGAHPKTGKPVQVLDGRYGPYVKHDKQNASLPKTGDPDTLDMAGALELLDKKAKRR